MSKNAVVDVADEPDNFARSSIAHPRQGCESSPGIEQPEEQPPVFFWDKLRHDLKEPFSEFFGVLVVLLVGNGVTCQVFLSEERKGNYLSLNIGWGVAFYLGAYAGRISGSHLNPGVTFASCILRRFPWKKLPWYVLAQTLGAFFGSLIVYGNYKSAIDVYEGGANIRTVPGYSETATAGMFWSYPADFMTTAGVFFSEFIGCSILMFSIFILKDDKFSTGPLFPLGLFFTLLGIGLAFGWETGYALNPARDFGPRLMTYCVGYGPGVWTAGNHFFWIPIVASSCGCTFGGWIHDMFLYPQADSVVNTPWFGLKRLISPNQPWRRTNDQSQA